MITAGVIAEYNPFHNGHAYHLKKTREMAGADFCITVMSGDFTQRGTPAILDKYARAEMALRCGADLVLELPACYAVSSAEYFAQGAVTLLHRLGTVDVLSFGSECGSVVPLWEAARTLAEEPEAYRRCLKALLKEGLSFPAARSRALIDCLRETGAEGSADPLLFSSPNNILGLEYCKALQRLESSIKPFTVSRLGDGYHAESLSGGGFSSASAIRRALLLQTQEVPEALRRQVPAPVFSLLQRERRKAPPVTADDFSAMLHYKLLWEEESGYRSYLDVSSSLSDRLRNRLPEFVSWSSFSSLLKTRELTHTRLNRALCHILTGLKTADMAGWRTEGEIFYARILGFTRRAEPLLSALGKSSSIPLLSKPANAPAVLDTFYQEKGQPGKALAARRMFAYDTLCSHLWQAAAQQKTGKGTFQHEYRRRIVIPEEFPPF